MAAGVWCEGRGALAEAAESGEMQFPGEGECCGCGWMGGRRREAGIELCGRVSEEAHTASAGDTVSNVRVPGRTRGCAVRGARRGLCCGAVWCGGRADTSSSCRPWRPWTTWLEVRESVRGEAVLCG